MRTACWTCRSRTIECDKTGTPCAKCEKAGLECFEKRPLRWVRGVAIRGKLRGRVLGGDPKVTGQSSSTKLQRKQVISSPEKALSIKVAPPFALQDPCVHDLDWSSRFYLDYYKLRIAKLFILHDSDSNPFRILLTHATEEPLLRAGIIAVAARHFANTGQSFDQTNSALSPRFVNANVDALYFKRQAIKELLTSLSHVEPSRKDAIMATILLLIFLDLLESGIDGWKYHLNGAEGLIKLSHSVLKPNASQHVNSEPGETVEETRQFVARQLSLVSTIGGALSDPKVEPESCMDFEESRHQESIVRSFLGCPSFLLKAIRYFSNQRQVIENLAMHDDTTIQDHDHLRDTQAMLELTADFDCLEWASASVQSSYLRKAATQQLCLLAEAYRTAAMLYGTRVLRAFKTPTMTIFSDNEELVLRLLVVIDSLKCDEDLFKCLLWPTFIAGLECQTDFEQELVIKSLRRLWDLTCCLNVIGASNILHAYWKRKDSSDNLAQEESQLHVIEQGWLLI